MNSDFFNDLKQLLEKLPGIGPRQASRFVWALMDFDPKEREKLANLINSLDQNLQRCGECFRAFYPTPLIQIHNPLNPPYLNGERGVMICGFCHPASSRDHSKIMVVERDSDLLNIEKTKIYGGLYHVLGGALDPLEKDDGVRRRIKKLQERVTPLIPLTLRGTTMNPPLKVRGEGGVMVEIILALSPTKLGEFTAGFIEKVLEPLSKPARQSAGGSKKLKISRLARGLSTGTDLEYADETTLRQALDNRK